MSKWWVENDGVAVAFRGQVTQRCELEKVIASLSAQLPLLSDTRTVSEAYKVVKDGHAWDYSTHPADVAKWRDKILREEPDAHVVIVPCTLKEMMDWKQS